jgi:hypothetical protein
MENVHVPSELSKMLPEDRRRERARAAQRRSRAQRRADFQQLENKVEALTNALEEMTETCMHFSDTVISTLEYNNPVLLRRAVKPFISKILSITRNVADDENEVDEISLRTASIESSPPGRNSSRSHSTPRRVQTCPMPGTRPLDLQLSPRMTYGLFPSESRQDLAPLDILYYLNPERFSTSSFCMALFWNTLFFASNIVDQPTSPLWHQVFYYPLQLYNVTRVKTQIQRRLRFKPNSIKICVPTDATIMDPNHPELATMDLEEVEFEARQLQRDHEMILEVMPRLNDSLSAYLEADGVEGYLSSRWGIDMTSITELSCASVDGSVSVGPSGLTCIHVEQIIGFLASHSKCLGNRIGFPIKIVDEAATSFLGLSLGG